MSVEENVPFGENGIEKSDSEVGCPVSSSLYYPAPLPPVQLAPLPDQPLSSTPAADPQPPPPSLPSPPLAYKY
ncbi:hypothetical protein BaRGS_00001469 [Batillaria attramentaria]|uniref:Uncharacterized protein n=1 Tax=Batillaria attramentaria TaxID=370345 RepID=A0ABD0M7Y3_9CAEN